MKKLYELQVTLNIKAPFISSGGEETTRGLDRQLCRDCQGQPAIRGSHIKGKLKEAMVELIPANLWTKNEILHWFGPDSEDDPDILERSHLFFSEFSLLSEENFESIEPITRISIEKQSGTAKENFLQVIEHSGKKTHWRGVISFIAEASDAEKLKNNLTLGLKWITAFGGIKGCGFGILQKVETEFRSVSEAYIKKNEDQTKSKYNMTFEFIDDLFVGGVRKKINYGESEDVIPGSVIKGSLAHFLNILCGAVPNEPISSTNLNVAQKYPNLAEAFTEIRITHALPSIPSGMSRPVRVPFSTIKTFDDKVFDLALSNGISLDNHQNAPSFQIDWKDSSSLNSTFGWANCRRINKTRTKIEQKTRTAKEEMLYTMQYISPYTVTENGTEQKVKWVSNVLFPNNKSVIEEFFDAISCGWRFLGKKNSRFNVQIEPEYKTFEIPKYNNTTIVDGYAIVVLQTDALMFDGFELAGKSDEINIFDVYCQYWKDVTYQSLSLEPVYFARQKLIGGYIARKFNKHAQGHYYPYVLTEAGSVFVLKVVSESLAIDCLEKLEETGLPIPKEIEVKLNEDTWKDCPFVPQNGFGEIAVNLQWHWEKDYKLNRERSI